MASLNRVEILGNLGQDPEIRSMQSGDKVANLSVATSETWTDKQSGEKKERTEWHRVVIWGPLAKVCEDYLSKGDKVYLSGKLQTRKWQDQSGADRYSTEIVLQGFDGKLIMLSPKDSNGGGRSAGRDDGYSRGGSAGGGFSQPREDFSANLDDEIPF